MESKQPALAVLGEFRQRPRTCSDYLEPSSETSLAFPVVSLPLWDGAAPQSLDMSASEFMKLIGRWGREEERLQ